MTPQNPQFQVEADILPAGHWAQQGPGKRGEDDSDDSSSTTESLNSSILDHHVLTLLLNGKLHLAPLPKDINKAVDIGTGTGIWAIDFAEEYPEATIIGTDIAPIQTTWVPPNLAFYEPASGFESENGCLKPTHALYQWGRIFVEGGRKLGRSWTLREEDIQRKAMEEAGFVDVQVKEVKTPMGTWPRDKRQKEIGAYMQLAFEQDAEGTVLFMATTLGWSREEVGVFLECFRREIREGNTRAFFRQRIVWGRKP
ncbi:S-adenosyl-L-methionine-dependent methyltransferase [Immersiella caudata]|uniref:S-adenosyl-L-methionine-dependent methyltransferase n=1 Tax=Immersiella caudata TaxID=314043 RepID=A0AA40BZU4_9PEZI|nr:S-adenosyl-L-methionine-dependent methyltransferase [Immersiella caudata]